MIDRRTLLGGLAALPALGIARPLAAQDDGPLRIDITEGVIEPMPFAVPDFVTESGGDTDWGRRLARVVGADLAGTGLFREIPQDAHIATITSFASPVAFADWRAVNAQALVTGAVAVQGDRIEVKFRVWDVVAGAELGDGLRFQGTTESWRRMAHKVADAVYSRITGEDGYFDSRVAFVSESGPKGERRKRLAVMDYDGENVRYLTDGDSLVLAPRFSPTGDRLLYTSYETGRPRIYLLDVGSVSRRALPTREGATAFSPRFSPDGRQVLYSQAAGGNTDLWRLDIASGRTERLTRAPSIETAPSYAPDGSRIVFESDRSGGQQLYVMQAEDGSPRRISFGQGRYGTPVWSPRGDRIAFTKQASGRFHIGVMRPDGSDERLLTASFLDESPTWAPNGRVLMFSRETQGERGTSALYSVDVSGRNLQRVPTPSGGSDPSWGPLQS